MNVEAGVWIEGGFVPAYWLDDEDEQEDELDDVHKGILDAPTDDEGAGEVAESNKGDEALEKSDEDAGVVQTPPDPAEEKKEFPGF